MGGHEIRVAVLASRADRAGGGWDPQYSDWLLNQIANLNMPDPIRPPGFSALTHTNPTSALYLILDPKNKKKTREGLGEPTVESHPAPLFILSFKLSRD